MPLRIAGPGTELGWWSAELGYGYDYDYCNCILLISIMENVSLLASTVYTASFLDECPVNKKANSLLVFEVLSACLSPGRINKRKTLYKCSTLFMHIQSTWPKYVGQILLSSGAWLDESFLQLEELRAAGAVGPVGSRRTGTRRPLLQDVVTWSLEETLTQAQLEALELPEEISGGSTEANMHLWEHRLYELQNEPRNQHHSDLTLQQHFEH